jgi:hypothetical protein
MLDPHPTVHRRTPRTRASPIVRPPAPRREPRVLSREERIRREVAWMFAEARRLRP